MARIDAPAYLPWHVDSRHMGARFARHASGGGKAGRSRRPLLARTRTVGRARRLHSSSFALEAQCQRVLEARSALAMDVIGAAIMVAKIATGELEDNRAMEDIAERIEARRPQPGKRGAYRKRTPTK